MKKYKIIRSIQLLSSLENLVINKTQFSPKYAEKFKEKVIDGISSLNVFPYIGKPIGYDRRAKVIDGHLLIYSIDEKSLTVKVLTIVDPRQYLIAKKYY